MSIVSHYDVYVANLKRRVVIGSEETHAGHVIKIFSKLERLMSDVYANVSYATVAEPDFDLAEINQVGYNFKTVRLGDDEFGWTKNATIDASPELVNYLAERNRIAAEREEANRKLAAVERENARLAEQARLEALPKRGDTVTISVDRRCRNPLILSNNGKQGLVFWKRDNRCGVALSDVRDARGNYTNVVWCTDTQIVKVA